MKNSKDMKNLNLVLLLLLLMPVFSVGQTEGERPNIILIFVDDLGYTDVGFNRDAGFLEEYGIIPTPEIDALAAGGVVAKNAHVAHPFCGPSRVALMTGVYPHRICAQYNLPNDLDSDFGVSADETFFSKVLQDNNYNTAAIGKWHLGVGNEFIPNNRGFDYFFGMIGGGHEYFESIYEPTWIANGGNTTNEYRVPLLRNTDYVAPSEFENDEYLTDILTEETVSYINENGSSPDPFFIYLAYNAPHTPLQAPAADIAQFKADNPDFESLVANSPDILTANIPNNWNGTPEEYRASLVEDRVIYATMVTIMDRGIGEVKDAVDANGLTDNTLIIFMSDNGGKLRQAGAVNYPLTAGKGSTDEGGHRVPMLFNWPNTLPAGATYDHLVSSLDLYPSFLELAGAAVPDNKLLEGTTVINNLLTNQDARPEESVYVMRPYSGFHNGAVMNGNYKISKKGNNPNLTAWKLYDIISDPGEQNNIRSTLPNGEVIVNELLQKAATWVSDFEDVDPCWFDHNNPHPHQALWNNGNLPNYEALFGTTLGINEFVDNPYTIYPNPTIGHFTLNFETNISKLEIQILSQTGKLIKEINGENTSSQDINISELSAGFYMVKILGDNKISIEKIIKL